MSFRLFIYYCALCGGAAAFVGWAVGRSFDLDSIYLANGVKGLWLGIAVALILSLVDVLWSGKSRQIVSGVGRVLVAVLIGGAGAFWVESSGSSCITWLAFSMPSAGP